MPTRQWFFLAVRNKAMHLRKQLESKAYATMRNPPWQHWGGPPLSTSVLILVIFHFRLLDPVTLCCVHNTHLSNIQYDLVPKASTVQMFQFTLTKVFTYRGI